MNQSGARAAALEDCIFSLFAEGRLCARAFAPTTVCTLMRVARGVVLHELFSVVYFHTLTAAVVHAFALWHIVT